ncbi:type III-B CRISPR-associated protein Cas10/Cmr2 [Cylindrospermum sp. FACHB-282]|uniref:type III-B CRISPR-associated protein Cas10/Cmr2 n=1 Tax=Cylindrospermum sp. FACHB-282 TaxID=2692794 RepID=UPI001687B96A|nr:type III-B CRISPR-associated protein Cas10/Cmr2 [Cylindrospermum sp. FACHB-282]MBD2384742.1 type III-B CRISPR-associated protein Cas10/Cmr2 [Cylindrospermum sp. FACHB-282]
MTNNIHPISIGIAWCLAWGNERKPKFDLDVLKLMHQALKTGVQVPQEVQELVDAVKELDKLDKEENYPKTVNELEQLTKQHPILWESKIGLIYGGATKIKQYVFEESKLPDIRGASGLLDQINTVDLPAFFNKSPESNLYRFYYPEVRDWVESNFPDVPLLEALIPELIIYSCGGNILAFCPAAFVDDLANAIEKRYTYKTLTANSGAVGDTFRLLEIRFGLLRDNIKDTFWLEQYQEKYEDKLVESYFGKLDQDSNIEESFKNRKSFNELTTKLVILFNQRRSGNETENRPNRRYPPMLETHPYLRRDETEKRSAITQADKLPGKPYFSEPSAIKRKFGDRAKTGEYKETVWDKSKPPIYEGWVQRFEKFLDQNPIQKKKYLKEINLENVELPESLTQLGNVSNGYIAYIYADGNNMGGAIQKIRTPKQYQEFSEDVDNATRYAVFQALSENLQPRKLQGIDEAKSRLKNGDLIHPFEIITIGGDDIFLIVPADKALQIAKMIGEQFENILLCEATISNVEIKGEYKVQEKLTDPNKFHRFSEKISEHYQCKLSMSSGVLITSYSTPIYYAEDLTKQLMKSAKGYAKILISNDKQENKKITYYGGTVDFFTLKSVTMISSNIEGFRKQALTINNIGAKLQLYAAPYTLPELDRLLKAIEALQKAEFPKSQLYQVRSYLKLGRRTASLNYYYFRHRLKKGQDALKADFEDKWCTAKTNKGNIAPWMYNFKEDEDDETKYETIWREMVDLFDLITFSKSESPQPSHKETTR